jgi:hypothetical protein
METRIDAPTVVGPALVGGRADVCRCKSAGFSIRGAKWIDEAGAFLLPATPSRARRGSRGESASEARLRPGVEHVWSF